MDPNFFLIIVHICFSQVCITIIQHNTFKSQTDVMFCAIWYHLHNLKNVKNTQGGVLLLVKLQASQIDFLRIFHSAKHMLQSFNYVSLNLLSI